MTRRSNRFRPSQTAHHPHVLLSMPHWSSYVLASNWCEQGRIRRSLINARLSHYVHPAVGCIGDDIDRRSMFLDSTRPFHPRQFFGPKSVTVGTRNVLCRVRRIKGGWFHDLWFPPATCGPTPRTLQVPGLTYHDGMGSYELEQSSPGRRL